MSLSLRDSHARTATFANDGLWPGQRETRQRQTISPWLSRQLRRCWLVLWWTLTFQLHTHAVYWLRAHGVLEPLPVVPAEPPVDTIDAASVIIPATDDPVVSVIIPTYGQLDYTLRCLTSIMQNMPVAPIEVIVVDDAWPMPESEASPLQAVGGIRLIRNDINLGYLRSCNKAAAQAHGAYVYFLNNDTEVMPGWLDPMLSLLRDRPDAGAIGAKLLFPDGSLQEAGGIIWRDASGWNFGRHEDPNKPLYNYVREVDYCSGAALLVGRDMFLGMGGFDERYAPAYFEDSDLSFRLRQIGLKTLYQPASRVIHYEGVSHGRDVAVGIKAYQVVNRRTFIETWGNVLAEQNHPSGQGVFRARDRAMNRKVVLVIDHFVPQPDRDAGSRTICGMLRVLVEAGMVVKFWPHNRGYSPGYTEALQAMGVEVFYGPSQAPFDAWIREFGKEFDLVLLSRPEVAEDVLPSIRQFSGARVIYYGHDLHFTRMRRQADITTDERLLRAAAKMEARERAIWRQADLSLYPSEEEADIAYALAPDCRFSSVIPYGFDQFRAPPDAPSCHEILFVAGFGHPPNEDAACWFVAEVLPLVRQKVPSAHLSIVGSNPTSRVRALASDNVSVRADVPETELQAAYASARVAVVPLRVGAGVKRKVVEALCEGLPLVTTPVGAQGLPGLLRVAAIETDPAAFAVAVVRLLTDNSAWGWQSSAQLAFAAQRFSHVAMADSVLSAINSMAARPLVRAA